MKKTFQCLFLLLIVNAVNAQVVSRSVSFKQGDQYRKQIFIRSDEELHRGGQKLDMVTNSSIYRVYNVHDTLGGLYLFKISTEKVADTTKAMGLQMQYSSETAADSTSVIEKNLKSVIGKTTNVSINKSGIIKAVKNTYPANKNDSLLTMSGLLPDELMTGNTFELITRLPVGVGLKKGNTWADTVFTANGSASMDYTIDDVTDTAITVSFKGVSLKNFSTRQNAVPLVLHFITNMEGKMKVDNNSAIITERFTKTVTSGFESINGISIAIEKRGSVVEIIKKL